MELSIDHLISELLTCTCVDDLEAIWTLCCMEPMVTEADDIELLRWLYQRKEQTVDYYIADM